MTSTPAADASVLPSLVGPAAGVATSMLWVLTSLFFTAAGKRIGATMVNFIRILIAIVLLGATHRLVTGLWWPQIADQQLLYLALSGLVGLTICDQALFTAFVDIGPRRALLLMTTSPLFATLFAWVWPGLGETVSILGLLGIAITLGGVAWVIIERGDTNTDDAPHPHVRRGIILALFAAVCQGMGMVFSKIGIGHGIVEEAAKLSPQTATFIRMIFGGLGMIPVVLFYVARRNSGSRATQRLSRAGKRSTGYIFTFFGAVVGPYLGVWMSLVAVDRMESTGIAQTLCSLSPVMILPIAAIWFHERITPRAVFGALIAVGGVALLTLTAS